MADLREPLAKLRRADEHRQAFDRVFDRFLETNPYTVSLKFDADSGWHEFAWQVQGGPPPSEELSLIFGDVLSNLRASFDYLVWQLVLAAGNDPGRKNSFSVVKNRGDWPSAQGNALQGVDDTWAAEIESLQPYHRTARPEIHPLAILDYVNNLNKHRFLPVTIFALHEWQPVINVERMATGEQLHFDTHFDQPIEDGAPLLRFRADSSVQLEVSVNEQPSVRVSFRDGLSHDWFTSDLIDWATRALAGFEPAFRR